VSNGSNKELKLIIRKAEAQGWEVTQNNASHLRWKAPDGGVVFTALTPSDWRAVKNILRDLKKYGFKEKAK
jgi:predicted RNA binding protein YcfA (HicA-like mRNA interferase family)